MNISTSLRRSLRQRSQPGVAATPWLRHLSTFEKVIIANSAIIILDTLVGWWITQQNPEVYHYLIDTAFIALALFIGLFINFLLLRAAFAPLHSLLATIHAVEQGNLEARAPERERDAEVLVLSHAFNAMLDQLARARNESTTRVLRAQEEERRRLALELHDQTGQSLTALALHAEAIAHRLADETSASANQACRQAERLSALAQQTLTEVQALSRQLRPAVLDDLGLAAALRWLAEDARQRLGIPLRVVVRSVERFPDDLETALFRIVQEALTNAIRHGHATDAACLLREAGGWVTLTIADNGRGFNAATQQLYQSTGGGSGLEGMRTRIRPLGGALTIRTQPGHGCCVHVAIPLSRPTDCN